MRFSHTMSYLKTHRRAIGQTAAAGNPRASRIVALSGMVHRRPEPIALALLEETVAEFIRSGEIAYPTGCVHTNAN